MEVASTVDTVGHELDVDLARQIQVAERLSPSDGLENPAVDVNGIAGLAVSDLVEATVQAVCNSLVDYGPRLIESEFERIEYATGIVTPAEGESPHRGPTAREYLLQLDIDPTQELYGWIDSRVIRLTWRSFLEGSDSLYDVADFVLPETVDWLAMIVDGEVLHFGRRAATEP